MTTDYKIPCWKMVNVNVSVLDKVNACFEAAAERVRAGNAFIISEHDVRKAFRRVNTRKAAGPDGISGRVLRACADR